MKMFNIVCIFTQLQFAALSTYIVDMAFLRAGSGFYFKVGMRKQPTCGVAYSAAAWLPLEASRQSLELTMNRRPFLNLLIQC